MSGAFWTEMGAVPVKCTSELAILLGYLLPSRSLLLGVLLWLDENKRKDTHRDGAYVRWGLIEDG